MFIIYLRPCYLKYKSKSSYSPDSCISIMVQGGITRSDVTSSSSHIVMLEARRHRRITWPKAMRSQLLVAALDNAVILVYLE
ncbi:Maleylacetate reductase [Fusarium oxysporum f. sp. albedinis]|nr:Maleylacetate reductase [Fusarium oxysporum f. sp. albedinis]